MCEYTGDSKDPQRHIDIQLTEAEVNEAVKKILNEPEAVCSKTRLSPFYTLNKPPAVRIASLLLILDILNCVIFYILCQSFNRVTPILEEETSG